MNKVLVGLLLFSVSLNLYFYNDELFIFDDFEASIPAPLNDSVKIAQSSIKKEQVIEDSEEHEYNRTQQTWFEKSTDLFENKLKMSKEKITFYFDLRSQRSNELDDYIIPKLDAHYEKNGEGSPYVLTMEDSVFMGELNRKYMNKLKDLIGSEYFDQYESLKSDFNRELTLNDKKEMLIDF